MSMPDDSGQQMQPSVTSSKSSGRDRAVRAIFAVVVLAAMVGAVIVFVSGSPSSRLPAPDSSTANTAPSDDTIVYTVTGAASGMITYQNSTGDTAQITDLTSLPWTTSFTVSAGTEGFLYVSAQNDGYGAIGCSISINGQVVKQNTSSGQYSIVDCSA